MRYFLGLGSNLGDKKKNLKRALYLLKKRGVKILRASSLYRTQPVHFFDQPWFFNQAVAIEANCTPHALLRLAKQIEREMKRESSIQNGPRTIDIDILLAEQTVIQTKKLTIPHPRMEKRNFVLVPLKEIAADAVHPLLKKKIKELWKNSQDSSIVKKLRKEGRKEKKMKKTFALFLMFFLAATAGLALEIKGKVQSPDGKPIAEAVVLHRSSGSKTLTDEKGVFSLTIPDQEKIKLEIIHPEYMEEVFLLTAKNLPKELILILTPYIRQREEIVVTALRYPEPSLNVPAAETVVSTETLAERMAPNITDGVSSLPGVSRLGSGGFSLVPNIRGMARGRVLILIDNARLASERRTGPNASFIDIDDIEKIEVLRSPSSVFYGSDAIGGVINIFTKSANLEEKIRGKINANYGTVNQEKTLGFSLQGGKKNLGFYLSFQGTDAENYSSPKAEVLQSQFSQASLFGKISYQREKREIHFSFLGSRGIRIGKPNRDSSTKPTWYPHENQNLFQFHWLEKQVGRGEISFHAYLNPNFLETKSEKLGNYKSQESYSKTQSLDFGVQISYGKKFGENFRLNGGADFFGRSRAKAENEDKYFDSQGNLTKTFNELPFTRGRRSDLGFFISGDYFGIRNLDLVAGLRWDLLRVQANPGDSPLAQKSSHSAWTGFLASSFKFTENIVAFANLAKAYRVPTLSERFYTGITGRGFIIAQPGLKPETSLNLDAGLKFVGKRYFVGLYSFYYEIDDMIERYMKAEKIYTYGNIDKGRIYGFELELEYYPLPGWKLFGNLYSFKGESLEAKNPLNDIPPLRLFAGSRVWVGRFSMEITGTIQDEKTNPGPAEISIPQSEFFTLRAGYSLNSSLNFYCVCSNLFNKSYLERPDPEAMEEPGRNLIFGISYSF